MRPRLARLAAALVLLGLAGSCAYYNTFYLARKYYMKATDGQPYEVDRDGTTQRSNYTKSAEYAKKLLGEYPKSKYVDDAWLMWARDFVGTDDPLKAVTMLQEFETRFPKSDLRPDAEFFLGLAYRQAHKHEQAVASFDEFLAQTPKHVLAPYAFYERSKSFMSLQKYKEAAESAGEVLARYPKHPIYDKALRQRAEARFQQQDWAAARADFHVIGDRALTDDERLRFLLREVDCLESSRSFDEARALLRDARSHVPIPPPLPNMPALGITTPNPANPNNPGGTPPNSPVPPPPVSVVRTPAEEVYGRITLRMGGVELLAGHVDQAIDLYRSVFHDYPRSQLSAEAQYRIGYAYETGSDDFERARAEYARVREQTGSSQFAQQAQQRLDNLDRIDRFRTAGGADSLARKAEGRFLVAEHYLFSLDRPDRALDEYRAIYDSASAPSLRARALNAQAWLLARKLDRKPAADSLFWKVVREYPATEGQLAARDYLEAEGQVVPERLIVAPKETAAPLLDTTATVPTPPGTLPPSGVNREPRLIEPGAMEYGPGVSRPGTLPAGTNLGPSMPFRGGALTDSLRRALARRDSVFQMARSDTSAVGRARIDSLRRAISRTDTLGRGALMARIARQVVRPDSVVVAPDSARAPDFSQADTLSSTLGDARSAPARSAPLPPPPPVDTRTAQARLAAISDSLHRDAVRADSLRRVRMARLDSVRTAVRTDSTHRSVLNPQRLFGSSGSGSAADGSAPVKHNPYSITSFERVKRVKKPHLTAAERDSVHREEQQHAEAKRDSLKHVAAVKDSVKRARKQAPAPASEPGAPPPAPPDSTRGRRP